MKYLSIIILMTSLPIMAQSECQKLYEKELSVISGKVDYDSSVGGQVYVNPLNGNLGYSPGIKLHHSGPNWARDFLYAIQDGPESTSFSITKGKKKEFLKDFSKALGKECKLKDDYEYKNLRAFLQSLLDNKNFCPENKILKPSIFGSYKKFHKIALKSLQDSDEFGLCDDTVISDDSHRSIKDIHSPSSKKSKKNGAKKN